MISSLANQEIKELFKLKLKKHRDQTNLFLVFGEHLIEEAIKTKNIVKIYTTNSSLDGELISTEIMNKLKDTITPFERVAIVKKLDVKPYSNKILVLDDVQDPLNVGSLIRTAIGFGFKTIIASSGAADFYNEKVVRASQGTLFYGNLIRTSLEEELDNLKDKGYQIVITTFDGDTSLKTLKNLEKIVLVLGNEGSGISEKTKALATKKVTIKTTEIESLNVSHAGAILMYEVSNE